ncbi:NAD(+)/NADH kinase [Lentibacter algarum]|uniref:NAD(+)/NADH kinase n=1 Tax=Lentibacter algarum TaxID=576131 RepID=UPI001C09B538|nr:NAD(+)/NADH kinase [Lentibacter algarum]MBU2983316.1 NAD(+)/NADH kinase [Lentibacter algarum]
MTGLAPRIVFVTRHSEYQALLLAHGTRGQAEFFLKSRDQKLSDVESTHTALQNAIRQAKAGVPDDWSVAEVERNDLDRFLFGNNDIIIAVGQDGLVANLAKYLSGQPVIGVLPSATGSEGVLTSTAPAEVPALLDAITGNNAQIQPRTMVEANLSSGESLVALNELFIGHRSHQSAKYILQVDGKQEFQSSSGVIITTGTGATGWAKSIMTATSHFIDLKPTDTKAAYFAREPWPSKASGCTLKAGQIGKGKSITITSRINEGGVIFADGMEQDFLKFDWGRRASITVSHKVLNLVVGSRKLDEVPA